MCYAADFDVFSLVLTQSVCERGKRSLLTPPVIICLIDLLQPPLRFQCPALSQRRRPCLFPHHVVPLSGAGLCSLGTKRKKTNREELPGLGPNKKR